jgi:hypothetical protein
LDNVKIVVEGAAAAAAGIEEATESYSGSSKSSGATQTEQSDARCRKEKGVGGEVRDV